MTDRPPASPETTAPGTDPVSELLYRWDRQRQEGVDVTPEQLCRDAPELLDEVARRVRALEAMYGVPNRAADTATPSGPVGDARPRVPGYEVGQELGRGGMGVVWKARDTRLNRTVALKMLPGGGGHSSQARARFQVEAEAAAGLHHPHIVQVYEVGDAGGCPYLALEYVEGGSLADRLAAGGPLPFDEAAGVVETVARAVDHAHRHGVLHRDLKPANILLANAECGMRNAESKTEDPVRDSAPPIPHSAIRPKVADFGLAKRLGSDAGATRTGDVLGTPAYMAPEQAAGKTAGVGVAGDVYGLGGVLYCCLTGRPPFDAATALETLSRVVNDEPAPPGMLRPGCPRDLEVIALKCLRKDPGKRYATAAGLADDLGRWRAGEPIHARPVRLPERLWLWARRRPGLAAVTAALVLVAAGSVAGLTALYLEARRQRDFAEDRRKDAEYSAAAARTTIAFFVEDVFSAARPEAHGGLGPDVTLVKALAAALPRIEPIFAGLPTAEAELRDNLADVYIRYGNYPAELAQLERCVALRRGLDPDDPITLRSCRRLAEALRKVGRTAEAEPLLRDTLGRQAAVVGADSPDAARTEGTLGQVALDAGRRDEAEALFRHALEVCDRHLGPDDPLTLEAMTNLGVAYTRLNRLAEAEPLLRRSTAARERVDPRHPQRIAGLNALAGLLIFQGRFADAEGQLRALLEVERATLGADNPETLQTEMHLGVALTSLDRAGEAEPMLRRAYGRYAARKDDPGTRVPAGLNLAIALLNQGKAADADGLTAELVEVARSAAGRTPAYLASALHVRASCLLALGRANEAVPAAREAKAIRQKVLPAGDPSRATTDSILGACLAAAGEVAEAEPLLVAAHQALTGHPAVPQRVQRDVTDRLARLYEKTGRPEKAAEVRGR